MIWRIEVVHITHDFIGFTGSHCVKLQYVQFSFGYAKPYAHNPVHWNMQYTVLTLFVNERNLQKRCHAQCVVVMNTLICKLMRCQRIWTYKHRSVNNRMIMQYFQIWLIGYTSGKILPLSKSFRVLVSFRIYSFVLMCNFYQQFLYFHI